MATTEVGREAEGSGTTTDSWAWDRNWRPPLQSPSKSEHARKTSLSLLVLIIIHQSPSAKPSSHVPCRSNQVLNHGLTLNLLGVAGQIKLADPNGKQRIGTTLTSNCRVPEQVRLTDERDRGHATCFRDWVETNENEESKTRVSCLFHPSCHVASQQGLIQAKMTIKVQTSCALLFWDDLLDPLYNVSLF